MLFPLLQLTPLSLCDVLLFLSPVFVLKSILSNMSIDIPASFLFLFSWIIFFHSFSFSLCVFFYLNCVFWRQLIDGSYLFMHSTTLCTLIKAFKSWYLIICFWHMVSKCEVILACLKGGNSISPIYLNTIITNENTPIVLGRQHSSFAIFCY